MNKLQHYNNKNLIGGFLITKYFSHVALFGWYLIALVGLVKSWFAPGINIFYSSSLLPIHRLLGVRGVVTIGIPTYTVFGFFRCNGVRFLTSKTFSFTIGFTRNFSLLNRNMSYDCFKDEAFLTQYPDDVIDIFKTRLKRTLTNKEVKTVNNSDVLNILLRVQELMKNAELNSDSGRSGVLETGSWFLKTALSIIQNKEYDTWERQMALEMLSMHYESRFISSILESVGENSDKGVQGLLIRLLNKSLPHFVDVLDAFINKSIGSLDEFKSGGAVSVKAKLIVILYILEPVTVASIVFTNMVRVSGSSGGVEELELINHVWDYIQTHLKLTGGVVKHSIPEDIKHIWEVRRDDILMLTAIEKIEIGQALVDMCLKACDELFSKESVMLSKKDKANIITIKDEFLVELSDLAFNPLRLPMIHKPVEWSLISGTVAGGYLHPVYNQLVNSKGLVHHEVGNSMHSEICINQINAVNFLNAQEFLINEDMLDYLLSEWNSDDSVIFSVYNKPRYEKKYSPSVQEHNSIYWMYRNILNIAMLFRGEKLYFPVFMDFRGRMYPLVSYLSYQGGDVARSLLCFNTSSNKPSENQHILIYLCNVFGHNNRSMKGRIKWAETTFPHMVDLYENDRCRFVEVYLSKAKEKAQFMSCFLGIYKSFHLSKKLGPCHSNPKTPVLFDATCSGMQHLSALTTDIDLATLVNLTNHELNDFYGHCAEIVRNVIDGLPDKRQRDCLRKVKIDRKFVKLPVMTIPYNIGLEGLTEKITAKFITEFEEQPDGTKKLKFIVPGDLTVDNTQLILTGREAGKLGSIIYHTVRSLMPPIKPLKEYFEGMINVLEKLNRPVFWVTPAGMKIWGAVLQTNSKRVKTPLLKNSKPITIRVPTDSYAYPTIKRAFMANFIHSLDAANIHNLIKIILSSPDHTHKKLQLYTIHDCFASVNDQMDIIEHLVRKAFSNLYFEQNYLEELDTCLIGQIKSYGCDFQISESGVKTVRIENSKTGEVEIVTLPTLPVYNWEVNKEFLKEQILIAEYFIS